MGKAFGSGRWFAALAAIVGVLLAVTSLAYANQAGGIGTITCGGVSEADGRVVQTLTVDLQPPSPGPGQQLVLNGPYPVDSHVLTIISLPLKETLTGDIDVTFGGDPPTDEITWQVDASIIDIRTGQLVETSSTTVTCPSVTGAATSPAIESGTPSSSPAPATVVEASPTGVIEPEGSAAVRLVPTVTPSAAPTLEATGVPTEAPTQTPTVAPTARLVPTVTPTTEPTVAPTAVPTEAPTEAPMVRLVPTVTPQPTATATTAPTATSQPTQTPTTAPTATSAPTTTPTTIPTATSEPTETSTAAPAVRLVPTATSTVAPTMTPTIQPTATETPTVVPTATETPTVVPTATETPTTAPTATTEPTATATPTIAPTATETPTVQPTATQTPTVAPTATLQPTQTVAPTVAPTVAASPTAAFGVGGTGASPTAAGQTVARINRMPSTGIGQPTRADTSSRLMITLLGGVIAGILLAVMGVVTTQRHRR